MAMTIEEKRQVLYAALLRYSPEAGSLRERVLDRVVLVALLESSPSQPMKVGQIQTFTQVDPWSPGLRTEVIQDALNRLIGSKRVGQTLLKRKHSYYLTDIGRTDTDDAAESAGQLFEPVLARMLRDTSHLCDEEDGALVCRTFVSECFARFGQHIAKAVTGEFTKEQMVDAADIDGAFQAAINPVSLSSEAIASLRIRCIRFLNSTDPDDEELKFRLTQGYYVAQLLNLHAYKFNPLADDAFSDSILYIDTNVLIYRLLSDEGARLFDELVRICTALGIELRVSRATIDETRWVAAGRLKDIEVTLATVPDELVRRTRDAFLDAFVAARSVNPELTVDIFLNRFDEIPNLLEDLEVTLHDRTVEEIIGDRDVARECEAIQSASMKSRGRGKSDMVCKHDVCHYLLIDGERRNGRKAWFLTRDKTLSLAALDLGKGQPPFCFPLAGFLQSVSPFLEATDVRRSIVDLFSAVLNGEIGDLSGDSLFDISELKIISEFHTDVFSTPMEQLIPAFDYVKNTVLGGKSYQRDDQTKVALELKKFLISSTEKKQRELQAEMTRQKDIDGAARERLEREQQNAETEISRLKEELEGLTTRQKDIDGAARERLEREQQNAETEISRLKEEAQTAGRCHVADARREAFLRVGLVLLGAILTMGIWIFDSELVSAILRVLSLENSFDVLLNSGVRLVGAAVLVLSSFPAVLQLKPAYSIGIGGAIAAIAVGGSDLIEQASIDTISGYLEIGVPIAVLLTIIMERSRVFRQEDM